MEYEMRLRSTPFAKIKSGTKKVELRLYDEKRRLLTVGDILLFRETESGESLRAKILKLDRFTDFFALYQRFDKIEMGYSEEETANPEDMYLYYTREEVARYGVLAITIEKI